MVLCPFYALELKKDRHDYFLLLLLLFFFNFKGFKYSLGVNWLQNFARKSLIIKICFPDMGSLSLPGKGKGSVVHSSLSSHNLSVKRRLPTKH